MCGKGCDYFSLFFFCHTPREKIQKNKGVGPMCLGNGPVFCQFIVCGVGLAGKWGGKILDLIILVLHLFAYFPFKELLRRVRGHFGRTPANHPASQPGSASARKGRKPGFGQASWQYYFCD